MSQGLKAACCTPFCGTGLDTVALKAVLHRTVALKALCLPRAENCCTDGCVALSFAGHSQLINTLVVVHSSQGCTSL